MLNINRRRFVEGMSAGAFAMGLGPWPRIAEAQPVELTGNHFNLEVGRMSVNYTGNPALAVAINGLTPGPRLRWREGETVTIDVTNRLDVPTSIHWHGILLPWEMDGVPGLSYAGIAPGATFRYRFPVRQSGTYWYHSHSEFQEQLGMIGSIVIDPRTADPIAYDRDEVVLLSDWTDADPARIFSRLKKMSHYYNFNRRTLADVRREAAAKGWSQMRADREMWNQMRMSDRDLADVTGAAYTYLTNGVTPAGDWRLLFQEGERLRLRFVNASAMTIFDVRIPGLDLTIVAADGQPVEPVTVAEFRIGVAETYDVVVRPQSDSAYAIFAQSIDRLGYARGTLTPDPQLSAVVPELDPPPVLSMVDMGMGMGGAMAMQTGAMKSGAMQAAETMHSAPMQHAGHSPAAHAMHQTDQAFTSVSHAPAEFGAGIDMRVMNPQTRLDDPGVGLRERSWPVLTYGALRYAGHDGVPGAYDREIELHLTGNMERYMWSFNGTPASRADAITLTRGERVRFVLVNDTMMTHPIHLHGLWSDLETGGDGQFARKHTVLVQPGQRIAYGVAADSPGPWAYHCHLLYHMEAGMFRIVHVE